MLDTIKTARHAATMNVQMQWLSTAQLILNGFAYAGALVIAWMGWLRTRELAWLVLAAWALSVLAGIGLQSFYPMIAQMFFGNRSGQMPYQLLMWFQLFRSVISSVLLLGGLAWLVFVSFRTEKSHRT